MDEELEYLMVDEVDGSGASVAQVMVDEIDGMGSRLAEVMVELFNYAAASGEDLEDAGDRLGLAMASRLRGWRGREHDIQEVPHVVDCLKRTWFWHDPDAYVPQVVAPRAVPSDERYE